MDDYARALAEARLTGAEAAPPPRPLTLAEGYAIQDRAAPRLGTPVGWKIGATSNGAMAFLGVAEPIRGRLFAERLFTDGAAMDLGNGAEAEPEIMLTLGRPLAPGADPLAAVSRACFAAELVRPTRSDAFAQGPGFIVADNAAGLAALIGPEVPLAALAEPAALRAELSAGDATTAGAADAVLGDPLRALAWLASALGELPAGTVVLTGAMARAIPAPPGAALLLDCGAWGRAWARVF